MENNKEKLEAMENTQANPSQQDAEISEEQLEAVAGGGFINGYDHCLRCGSTNFVVRQIPGPTRVPHPNGGWLPVQTANAVYCADCGDLIQIDSFDK